MRQLDELAEAAGDGKPWHGVATQIFQRTADEIAHVDQCTIGHGKQLLRRRLRCAAGGADQMLMASGAGNVDATMDRVDPGGAGKRHDDTGGAEDRNTAEDTKASVERLRRQHLATGDGDGDDHIHITLARRRGNAGKGVADHRPRTRVDRRLPGLQRKPRPRHRPHTLAGAKDDAGPWRRRRHGNDNFGAVRHVGIVAGILDHHGFGRVAAPLNAGQGQPRFAAPGQPNGYRDRCDAGQQRLVGGSGGSRGAGAGGPATAQSSPVGDCGIIVHGHLPLTSVPATVRLACTVTEL